MFRSPWRLILFPSAWLMFEIHVNCNSFNVIRATFFLFVLQKRKKKTENFIDADPRRQPLLRPLVRLCLLY